MKQTGWLTLIFKETSSYEDILQQTRCLLKISPWNTSKGIETKTKRRIEICNNLKYITTDVPRNDN